MCSGRTLDGLAVPEGVEPPTFGLGNRCSILLSYGTALILLADFSERWHYAPILLGDASVEGRGKNRKDKHKR